MSDNAASSPGVAGSGCSTKVARHDRSNAIPGRRSRRDANAQKPSDRLRGAQAGSDSGRSPAKRGQCVSHPSIIAPLLPLAQVGRPR